MFESSRLQFSRGAWQRRPTKQYVAHLYIISNIHIIYIYICTHIDIQRRIYIHL